MKDRISKPRVIAFLISILVPVVILALGVFLYIRGTVLNIPYILTFILLPIIPIILLALLIFSEWHAIFKILLSLILIAVVVFGFLFGNTIGGFELLHHYESDNLADNYAEATYNMACMPEISELGDPLDMDYYSFFTQFLVFFTCESDTLICKYSEEEYAEQKALLEEKYEFEEETRRYYFEYYDEEYIAEPFAEIDGYNFRMLKDDGTHHGFPKHIMYIATNDVRHEIVYVNFIDADLDYIGSTFNHINYDCGWRRIAHDHLDKPFEISDLIPVYTK